MSTVLQLKSMARLILQNSLIIIVGDGICRIPKYESVTVGGRLWSDYITNNDNVAEVIAAWDSAQGIISDKNNTTGAVLPGAVGKVTLAGWNSRSDGKGVNYTDGQLMNIDSDLTLYA